MVKYKKEDWDNYNWDEILNNGNSFRIVELLSKTMLTYKFYFFDKHTKKWYSLNHNTFDIKSNLKIFHVKIKYI